ncbi:adenylate and guanylate cyclase catalytic domain-containing protein [Ditylenchus destructor]|uniref:Guanylate cyclase n=1 Tax=Ditylenchus destructor TaxID=166010 RepID=A0AAD4NDE4_9BILA|nr:adenylate and guanylate cyclase catalytic domain-containing protein [Ditylenchus destructor]
MHGFFLLWIEVCSVWVLLLIEQLTSQNISATQTIPLKIGFIGMNSIEQIVFQEAFTDLQQTVTIDSRLNLSFEIRVGCEQSRGLSSAAEMYILNRINALIGPGCADGMDCVGLLTASWKIPHLVYSTSPGDLADKSKYSTVARISPTNANTFTDVILSILNASVEWKTAAILYNAQDSEVSIRAKYLLDKLLNSNVKMQSLELSPNTTTFDSDVLEQVDSIRRFTRVLIVLMGQGIGTSLSVLQMLQSRGISTSEFVIILPWLQRTPDERLPWLSQDLTVDVNVFTAFSGSVILDGDRNNTAITTRFFNRLISRGFTVGNEMKNFSTFSYLYDAMKLYLLALDHTVKQYGPLAVMNGSLVFEEIRELNFEDLVPVAEISPERSQKCNVTNETDCYFLDILVMELDLWTKIMNRGTEPTCGYDGSKCNNSNWYIISGVICISIVCTICVVYAWRKDKKKVLSRLPWLVPISQVQFINSDRHERKNNASSTDVSLATSTNSQHRSKAIVFNNTVKLSRFKQLKTLTFDEVETILLTSMKQLVHDNINPIVGMCCNNPTNELLVLWKYCSRGTLSDYLHNSEMRMDANFKTAFLRDIINGLDYLHNTPFGYHGNLCTSNCVIDANFIVKIVAVGIEDLLEEWKKQGTIAEYVDDGNAGEKTREYDAEHVDAEESLYRAPELLRNTPPTRTRMLRMNKSDQNRFKNQCRVGDIYSLSMIMYEVLFRKEPFTEVNLPKKAIISVLKNAGKDPMRPEFPKMLGREHHPAIISLMKNCWSENPLNRPHIKRIKKLFSTVYKITGGLVASVIAMMDQHAHSLEKQVRERTRLLEEAQMRADRLLAQMIPKDVARDLKLGKPVIPRSFTSASVLFTDIVSFTNICAESTPVEIVNFLNDLFTGYDDIIGQMDAFKVETIGDAYMVVSGVPKENGTEHAAVISHIALRMRKYLLGYKLPHMPSHIMQARWGMHSGPVAAGVVGLTAPRYCLFGDTVNMASRMESSGEPEKIQISGDLHDLLVSRGDKFLTEKRGIINVKGKGDSVTYWLLDESENKPEGSTETLE